MAENVDVSINVTGNANAQLDKINKNVQALEQSFGKLKNMVAGLVLGSLVTDTLRMADAVSDLGKATGLTTAQVMGFADAIKQNGGEADGAYKAIEKFTLSLEEARNGSQSAQDAFQEAGVSLKQISNLSTADAFSAYIKGIGQVEGESKRLANANTILGKSVRSVDFEGVAGSLDAYTIKNAQAAIAADKVADMVDNMNSAYGALQKVLLTVLTPIADFVNWLDKGSAGAMAFLDVLTAVGVMLIGGPLVKGLQLIRVLITWLISSSAGLGALGAAVGASITKIADAIGLIDLDKFRALVGLQTNAAKKAEEQAAAEAKLKEQLDKAKKEAEAKELQIKKASAAVELAAQKQIDASKKSIDQYNAQFDMQTKLMGVTEEQKLAVTTMYDLQQRKIAALLPLQEKLRELQSVPEAARGATANAEMAATQNAIANITKQYDAQVPVVEKLLQERIKQMGVERDLAYNADLLTKAYEAQASVEQEVNNISIGAIDKVMQMQNEYAQSTLPGVQAQLRKIADEQNAIATAAKRKVAIEFENDPQGLSNAIANIDKATKQAIQIQQGAATAIYNNQRTFEYGWEQAFNKYVDDATNAATRANDMFSSITGNMNSAIDKFVETGKFSFGDLATSIIKDLLKIELKAQATQLFKAGAGGLGSLFSGIGSLFGFANGGNPPVGKPSIVGENGPELFVPKTAGTVVPNGQFGGNGGGQTVNNNYVYNVSAIDAKSVATFFAENRKTMLGSVQMAQKELPYGNR